MKKLTSAELKLIEDNVPLARFLARKRWEMAPAMLDLEEMVSLANQGLVSAAARWRSYCEENGYSEESIVSGEHFSLFARKRIIGSILDWQRRDADHVPRSYRTDYKILQRSGYPESTKNHEELFQRTGISVERIKTVISAVELRPVYFGDMQRNVHESSPDTDPVSDHNVERSVVLTAIGEAVSARVAELPELQQVILALRYFESLELQSIALELGVTLAVIRESHNAAIESVYEAMIAAVTVPTEGE